MLPVVGEFEISASNHAVTASQDKTLKLPDALDKPDANPIPQPLPPHHRRVRRVHLGFLPRGYSPFCIVMSK
jgi:hypothetical protein